MHTSIRWEVATAFAIIAAFGFAFSHGSCGASVGNKDPYIYVQFVDRSTGWIVGGRLLKTTDGGKNWSIVHDGADGTVKSDTVVNDLHRFQFIDREVAITWRGNIFGRSSDGGRTWPESFSIPPAKEYQWLSFFFLNPKEGWAVGKSIYYTGNGGQSWQELAQTPRGDYAQQRRIGIDPELANYWPRLRFTTPKDGVMARLDGMVLLTEDGGRTWQHVFEANIQLSDVFFSDNLNGWLAGKAGFVARTRDGGRTWVPIKTQTSNDLIAINFVNANHGCAVGSSCTIVCTNDGGMTWNVGSIKSPPASLPLLVSISFADELNGWAVGGLGIESSWGPIPSSANIALITKDGGTSWEPVNLPQ